jgi:hypothetical protein
MNLLHSRLCKLSNSRYFYTCRPLLDGFGAFKSHKRKYASNSSESVVFELNDVSRTEKTHRYYVIHYRAYVYEILASTPQLYVPLHKNSIHTLAQLFRIKLGRTTDGQKNKYGIAPMVTGVFSM